MCDTSLSPFELLPNEVFAAILSVLSSEDLLPLAPVSRHFYCSVACLLHRRLSDTASLPENELILECYHPSAKIFTPYLSCRYLGTKTADGVAIDGEAPKLAQLRDMYSSFKPVVTEENRWRRFRFVMPMLPAPVFPDGVMQDETATQDIRLDDGEMFSQLCVTTLVAKEGPKRGLFYSHVHISDGFVRVFRDWLSRMAADSGTRDNAAQCSLYVDSKAMLWVDPAQSIGLRFHVVPAPSERMPLITGPGDEPAVEYVLAYEELLIRTSKLLFAVEAGTVQEATSSGKAVVIASM